MSGTRDIPAVMALDAPRPMLGRGAFLTLIFVAECATIVLSSIAAGIAYHLAAYDGAGQIESFAAVGVLAALCYTLPFLLRDEYRIATFLSGRLDARRVAMAWSYAFLALGVIAFLAKATSVFSRGAMLLFFVLALVALLALNVVIRKTLAAAIASGRIGSRRLMLVGPEDEIGAFQKEMETGGSGLRVVGTVVLPAASEAGEPARQHQLMREALTRSVERARASRVDDVVILTDWSRADQIVEIIEAFTVLPVSIHLGASSVIGRFSDARVSRLGAATALSLTAPPLTPLQTFVKRTFDIVLAAVALVLLTPLFALVALAIKLDSRGPVFFRQRRLGFNQQMFRIWKFRTMTTLDDGDVIVQAQTGDARLTRVGRHLRRTNIDELPQLLNVLAGEMSIVGPRPHAVAHDRLYETIIRHYPRRLKVLPGITGWAQVNGYRGRTDTEEAMRKRVEHDLEYVNNWSLGFDLYVILLTVLSPRAYKNAE